LDKVKFYPQAKTVVLEPLVAEKELQYTLEGLDPKITKEQLRLKFAFPAKWEIDPPRLKDKVKNILIQIIDAGNFTMQASGGVVKLVVPVTMVAPETVGENIQVKIPVLVKLEKVSGEPTEFKCIQEIELKIEAKPEAAVAAKPGAKPGEQKPGAKPGEQKPGAKPGEQKPGAKPGEQKPGAKPEDKAKAASKPGKPTAEEEGEEEKPEGEETKEEPNDAGLYSGLIAVDYGTSNSSVAVRDPCFAAEEVRGQLSEQQWNSLCEWMNIWLSSHLEKVEPTQLDLFVQNLTLVVPGAGIPSCGAPKQEILQALNNLEDSMRAQILQELLSRLSSDSRAGSDPTMMKSISAEVLKGFEVVMDCNTLESQRYFVLELDKNVGPAPISSVLQILSVPGGSDIQQMVEETKIDMGARVSLLLHSAALGETDIRQFVLSSKRYFGSNDILEVAPAEGNGEVVQMPADVFARVTYKELMRRAIQDIHRRASQGLFQDASWAQSLVATFPTSYPASLRKTIREILTDLQIPEIDTRFDEATAAAIYYIWREIGADPVCGMHGLMSRSRRDKYGRSYQNLLLYDLGGGTTDIALIQLLYEEVGIFEEGEDRGNGGSYFRITPRLLGTTGHRYLGGDLLTLWVFRFVKSKLADMLLQLILSKNLEPPMNSPLSQLLMDMPEDILEFSKGSSEAAEGEAAEGEPAERGASKYRPGALLEWTIHPTQYLRNYTQLNNKVIDVIVPTRFIEDRSRVPNFFTLWEITDEIKKTLGTPIIENFGTVLGQGLPKNWPSEAEIDSGQLYNFIKMIQPWLVEGSHIQQDDLRMVITQDEMNNVISDTIRQSISLAASLSKARLIQQSRRDRVDRLILAGLSCNMKAVQVVAEEVFRESEGIFDYDPANVRFDRDSAKTSVALGACIGRYMESVRIDPFNEKTRQMLRDGYDQIELVIENLFSYLACRLAYDSLVAMVPIFEQGQELNVKSYWDRKAVARTSIKDLRPVQEKFWVYRIDFPGAEPQYLGLINSESVAFDNGFEDFRKFREEYIVGFEADAELMIRCFFLPKGIKIIAKDFVEPTFSKPLSDLFKQSEVSDRDTPLKRQIKGSDDDDDNLPPEMEITQSILVKEPLDDVPVIFTGERLNYTIEYPDGTTKQCCVSHALSIRQNYEFKLGKPEPQEGEEPQEPAEPMDPNMEDPDLIAKFELNEEETDEATFVIDEDHRMIMLTKCLFDIQLYADIQFIQQKADFNLDPFCGQH